MESIEGIEGSDGYRLSDQSRIIRLCKPFSITATGSVPATSHGQKIYFE